MAECERSECWKSIWKFYARGKKHPYETHCSDVQLHFFFSWIRINVDIAFKTENAYAILTVDTRYCWIMTHWITAKSSLDWNIFGVINFCLVHDISNQYFLECILSLIHNLLCDTNTFKISKMERSDSIWIMGILFTWFWIFVH